MYIEKACSSKDRRTEDTIIGIINLKARLWVQCVFFPIATVVFRPHN